MEIEYQLSNKEVKEILSGVTTKDPNVILASWFERKSLEPVKESNYNTFVLSFPVEVDGKVVATVTLADASVGNQSDRERRRIMCKYMGPAEYASAHDTFSPETYKFCYIQVHEEFPMQEVVPGLEVLESDFTDAADNLIEYTLMWGYPEEEGTEGYYKWKSLIENRRTYRFLSGFSLLLEDKQIKGHSLGEEVNRRITSRSREMKTNMVLHHETTEHEK
jgi:hypothetical protein